MTLAAALYCRDCVLPEEPVEEDPGAANADCRADTAQRICNNEMAAAKQVLSTETVIFWTNFARGRIGRERIDMIDIRYPRVVYSLAQLSLWYLCLLALAQRTYVI